ncbi:dihydrolipoamide dehydrogenase [Desulfobotulus alkaliphilus]|uniref:Dihydrolipoyl dehydrogenase n=1 Tax=Desulfobotulus alkaliphilus TaxID=622671 RepID=A0A562RYY9_9BACT|nr:dihydrolipoyl dehydrogenase [Desulfobotulus alkaliphilus]TWI74315.1 dihydrolipoamide dehydrogenase [Desulfobotulus alkaliphilus]
MSLKISVIGAGPGGYVAAIRAAQSGAEVTLVEKEALGGTCLNWGCIPSKVMVSAATAMRQIRHAALSGIHLETPPVLDMKALQKKQQTVIATQQKGIDALLRHNRVQLISGDARIEGKGLLSVRHQDGKKTSLSWDRLIIATGTVPAGLPKISTDGIQCLSSNDFLRMASLPPSALIIGAGVVGCEFASILSGLGAKVDLVEMADRILPLPDLDASASRLLAREFKKQKIGIHTSSSILDLEKNADGIRVNLKKNSPATENHEKMESIGAACLVLCVGRKPNTLNLGLDSLHLHPDARGYLPVNDAMETACPGVFAIGDVTGPERIMLAHVASAEAEVAVANAMGQRKTMGYTAIPSAVFTEPEVAFVGLSAERARERGFRVKTTSVLMRSLGKAHATGQLGGEAVFVTEEKSEKILGCHLVGAHATELLAEATLAISKNLTLRDMAGTIHAHPTFSEIFYEMACKGMGQGLHG